jgi:diacylglycerol kinase (ATP)
VGKPGNTGIRRIIRATRFSTQGFVHAWQHEAAFRQEIGLTLVLLPVAMWLGRSGFERFVLIIVCLLVLIVELLNSAIEAAIDRHGDEHHELSGRAKDLGSAAVFLSLVIVVATWGTVAYLRFFA